MPYEQVTQKKPPMAEHSFNGVMFDVQAKAPFGLVIKSVHIGGMLGILHPPNIPQVSTCHKSTPYCVL